LQIAVITVLLPVIIFSLPPIILFALPLIIIFVSPLSIIFILPPAVINPLLTRYFAARFFAFFKPYASYGRVGFKYGFTA